MAGGAFVLPKARPSGPPYFSRNQVAQALHQVAVLLELNGANVFRVRSYQNASRMLGGLTQDLGELVASGELFELKGIGKGLGSALSQAIGEGRWPDDWIALHRDTPEGMIEMLGIPGLGPKRIKIMNQELGVDSITTLREAAEDDSIAGLKGFGAKSQQRMLDGIELLARFRSRRRLDIGLKYGEAFEQRIAKIPGVQKAQLAGSARRRKDTIGDLDLVVAVEDKDKESVSNAILQLPGIADIKGAGDSKISLILDTSIFDENFSIGHIDTNVLDAIGGDDYEQLEAGGTIDAQVRLVSLEVFPFTLAYFTGSKEHNIAMRQRAIDRGLRLSEFGLIPEKDAGDLKGMAAAKFSLNAIDENEIYRHLDLDWVTPELREDTGEILAAQEAKLPQLIVQSDIKGALHNHTTLSDGEASLEQMADAARKIGWNWLGLADHSPTLKIANGASAEDLLAQGELITKYNSEWASDGVDFRLFHGVESDILEGGKLDHPDDVLAKLDYTVASVHAMNKWKGRDEQTNTEELMKCIDHPSTTILGHPTGRILQGRDGYEVDMFAIIEYMAEYNKDGEMKAVELNASPYRLDLDWRLCKFAKTNNVPVIINPDAHSIRGLGDIAYGVMAARKGWLESGDVLNSLSGEDLANRLK
ncbi:MAG: DNA polymerase/3'-5' exonuclease PolX [Euryarchaeota archaeon]|jgi:DNA polymerase (family 10)|nr:DNA polymerase/3'-5' exonuclease PolX [Euryarchaeota archaeon]MBT5735476.1 DNA polymerase/3'-5' exonuclease PolX [Euryarchaeota archaeon]MBT7460037.1 DNA polymerase/3'-5' exonuclease PolX [Euryarchaeota archaeon]